jgi:hypothetical protein
VNREVVAHYAAVCADPLDPALRERLAVAYEAAGDADRARLIRTQLECASLPRWDARAVDLELAARALLAASETRWRARELPALDGVVWGRFERGMVAGAAFRDRATFVTHHQACASSAPLERAIIDQPFRQKSPRLPALPTLRELTLVGSVYEAKDLTVLADSPLLGSVRRLTFVDARLRKGLGNLLKSPHLGRLEALAIVHHHLGPRGLKPLLESSLPSLRELWLSAGTDGEIGSGDRYEPRFDAKAAYTLSIWPGLRRLETLDVSNNLIGAGGLNELLGSPLTAALRRLIIRNIADGEWDMDDSLTALRRGPVGALEELDIGDNDLNTEAAAALAQGAAMRALKILHIDNVRSRDFEALSFAPWLNELRILSCDADALAAILKRAPRQLHTLHVCPSGDDTSPIAPLASIPALRALKLLDLGRCELTDADLDRLGQLKTFPALVELRLRHRAATFTAEGATRFSTSLLGRQLQSFECGIEGLDRLPRSPPARAGGTLRQP